MILVQMKGGSAKLPKPVAIERLKAVKNRYHAKEVVLFEWKPKKGCKFSVLKGNAWIETSPEAIFG
jgi:hypothetical protein